MNPAQDSEEDIEHIEANLIRLFKVAFESLKAIEEGMTKGKAPDLSANTAYAEHLKDTIYSESLFFIAKWQPLGHELLYIESIIKVSYDLFRITRYANEIALSLALVPGMKVSERTIDVARRASAMVSSAFDALMKKKREEARKVDELDEFVDKAYREALKSLASKSEVSREEAFECIILRQLERVADHATYIAREVLRILGGGL